MTLADQRRRNEEYRALLAQLERAQRQAPTAYLLGAALTALLAYAWVGWLFENAGGF